MQDKTKYWRQSRGAMGVEYHLFFMPYYDYEHLASITLDNGGYPCVTSALLRMNEEPISEELTPEKAMKKVECMIAEEYQDRIATNTALLRRFTEEE